jgi:hypothetical protein
MPNPLEELRPRSIIRERDLAARWMKSPRFMQRLRRSGHGPAWFRVGATVFYRAEDIAAFEINQARKAEDER